MLLGLSAGEKTEDGLEVGVNGAYTMKQFGMWRAV